jgi:DNA-binding NtrC family response regulator
MIEILLVEDDYNARRAYAILLRSKGYAVEEAQNGQIALDKLKKQSFDLIITDLKMQPIDGMQVLKATKTYYETTEVIVITAFGSPEIGVEAMKFGAYDYITKPFDNDEFLILVKRAIEKGKMFQQVKFLQQELDEKYKFENIIGGSSPVMNKILKLVSQVATTDSTVLISGESGTGKELIAKAIHTNSLRKDKAMITVNCGSLPQNLLESELFGHVKGSFTGAIKDKKGLFQEADEGTLFLDEIGEIAPQIQASLLRFLQDGEIRRVVDNRIFRVNVRLIAATNKNLEEEVEKGNFREDLYYRLNVIPIHLPPLRERKEDIPLLIYHFLNYHTKKSNREKPAISPSAMSMLVDHQWYGNVRELGNFIERLIALNSKKIIEIKDLPFTNSKSVRDISERRNHNRSLTLSEMEKSLILETLEECNGNQKITAQQLDISTTTLWRKLKGYGIDVGEYKEA